MKSKQPVDDTQRRGQARLWPPAHWDVLGLIAVAGLPSLLYTGEPLWRLPLDLAVPLLTFAAGYGASRFASERRGNTPWPRVLMATAGIAVSMVVAAGLQLVRPDLRLSRVMALLAVGLGVFLVVLRESESRVIRRLSQVLVVAGAAWVVGAAASDAYRIRTAPPPSNSAFVVTSHHTIKLVTYDHLIPAADVQRGGAMTRIGDRIVAATGKGAFFQLSRDTRTGDVSSHRLPWPSPANADDFATAWPSGVDLTRFRVQDFIARPATANSWDVFASHHVWDGADKCVALVLSAMSVSGDLSTVVAGWKAVVRAEPCLPVGGQLRGPSFSGQESGGRLAWMAPDTLLWTTGDHEFDGWNHVPALAQDAGTHYGKSLQVNVTTGQVTMFTRGHRNPQGLYIDPAGTIWETEQGPEGGDELNVLVQGGNYGWPRSTYGTAYHRTAWPLAQPDAEDRPPVYAWVPSLAVSSLAGLEGRQFTRWAGNLLVGGLAGRTVSRVVLRGTAVAYVEPIHVGRRIRDVLETADGDVWLWGDEGDLLTMTLADGASRGEEVFAACGTCHLQFDVVGGRGPSLFGIVDRPVAADPNYTYSAAMKTLGGRWTRERLNAFLADPGSFAPGTTMPSGVADAEDRAALIEFLAIVPKHQ